MQARMPRKLIKAVCLAIAQKNLYDGESLGAIIHFNMHNSIWIQDTFNEVVTVPWYTTVSIAARKLGVSFVVVTITRMARTPSANQACGCGPRERKFVSCWAAPRERQIGMRIKARMNLMHAASRDPTSLLAPRASNEIAGVPNELLPATRPSWNLDPFMIHEAFPTVTETASGGHPCCSFAFFASTSLESRALFASVTESSSSRRFRIAFSMEAVSVFAAEVLMKTAYTSQLSSAPRACNASRGEIPASF
jgi:hypothetical protein